MKKIIFNLKSEHYKFRYLTIAIIFWFILFPFFVRSNLGLVFINILTTMIVFFGISSVSQSKKTVLIGLIFALPWFILSWIDIILVNLPQILMIISTLFLILFLAFTAITILLFILRTAKVDADIIYGAICTYFLIGGTWGTIYMLLEAVQPGSIIHTGIGDVGISDLLYFSFCTLTTLGYGDIIPVTATARSVALIEAIVGVMYITTIISRLVGLFITKSLKN